MHYHFRWQAVLEVLQKAARSEIRAPDIIASYELDGWSTMQIIEQANVPGPDREWFSREAYRIDLQAVMENESALIVPYKHGFLAFRQLPYSIATTQGESDPARI